MPAQLRKLINVRIGSVVATSGQLDGTMWNHGFEKNFACEETMRRTIMRCCVCGILLALGTAPAAAQGVDSMLLRIKAVGKEGAGNVDAAKAWKELVSQGPNVLPGRPRGSMDDANPIAVNWQRAAVESIQDRAESKGQQVSAEKLEAFIQETRHAGPSRRLAYECLVRLDPKTPERMLPKLLDDPSQELRRDAVAAKLKLVNRLSFETSDARRDALKELLHHARDRDQVNLLCDELKKLKVEIDQTAHYGFVTRWLLTGPFENTKGIGFNNVYPPEKGVDPKVTYPGKGGETARWKEHTTSAKLGLVDLNEIAGKLHGAVYYGYAAVSSEAERPVELRAGSNNAVRIWLNGKEIYFREEYHHGMEVDQHVGKGFLKAGRNEILIKVCQNEQTDSWAQQWSFQLRVCDSLGGAVPVVNVTEKVK